MSQFGMQMPGSARTRPASMNIYTGLMMVAVFCLIAAIALVYTAGTKIGPGGDSMSAFKIHPEGKSVQLKN